MNLFWSQIARELSPYVPGEQPRVANLVKLNTNESPFGPSPLALEAMRGAAADTLRLYPDPEATELCEALAVLSSAVSVYSPRCVSTTSLTSISLSCQA